MFRFVMKSKIHRATVTHADLDYVGSITIDAALMDAAGLVASEKVQVLDLDSGGRLETYVVGGPADSGMVGINGAAARIVHPGDTIIVISYAALEESEVAEHHPTVVLVDEHNRVTSRGGALTAVD